MGSTAKNISIGWLIAAIACSSLALFFATGLHPRWWLMWFMPIPVLLVAARSSGPRAFFVALVAWFLGSLNMWGAPKCTAGAAGTGAGVPDSSGMFLWLRRALRR